MVFVKEKNQEKISRQENVVGEKEAGKSFLEKGPEVFFFYFLCLEKKQVK